MAKYLGYICKKICHPKPLKNAQPGHADQNFGSITLKREREIESGIESDLRLDVQRDH